jgi:hypothetical protein
MALGILEPRTENVPGTVQVTRKSDNESSTSRTTILVPQPTDDPNDPLVSHLETTWLRIHRSQLVLGLVSSSEWLSVNMALFVLDKIIRQKLLL